MDNIVGDETAGLPHLGTADATCIDDRVNSEEESVDDRQYEATHVDSMRFVILSLAQLS